MISFLIPLIAIASLPFSPGDLSAWTALGVRALRTHRLQRVDSFSVLPTRELIYPSWGPSLLYGALYPRLGVTGLCVLHWIIPVLILLWAYRASLFRSGPRPGPWLRLALYAFWIGAIPAFAERPSALALIPLVLGFDEVSRVRSWIRPRQLAALVLLEGVWVNLHGSFALLPLMLGWRIALLAPAWRHRRGFPGKLGTAFLSLALVSLAGLANPFGWKVFPYVIETARASVRRGITEWAPVTPLSAFPSGLMQYALAGASLFLLARAFRRRRLRRELASPFFPLLLTGFTAVRSTALPFVVLLPYLARNARGIWVPKQAPAPRLARRSRWGFVILLAAAWVSLWPPFKPAVLSRLGDWLPEGRARVFDSERPVQLIERIRQSSSGEGCAVFGEIELGGALMLETTHRVFMDTRNIIYTDRQYGDVVAALEAKPGWSEYLASHGACFIAVDGVRHPALVAAATASRSWAPVAREGAIRLFERRGGRLPPP